MDEDDDLDELEEGHYDLEGLFDALFEAGPPAAHLVELRASDGARRRIVVRSWEESRGMWRAEVVRDSEPGGSTLGWYADSGVSRDRAFGMLRLDIVEQKGSNGIQFVHNPG